MREVFRGDNSDVIHWFSVLRTAPSLNLFEKSESLKMKNK